MPDRPKFLFATCQRGAERAVKGELTRRWPEFRFAFSRPGFLTFRLPEDHHLPAAFDLRSVFARTFGFSLGKADGNDAQQRARQVWQIVGEVPVQRIHVWQREGNSVGPSTEPTGEDVATATPSLAAEAEAAIRRQCPRPDDLAADTGDEPPPPDPSPPDPSPAERGDLVLDCILVEPDQWWVGYHRAVSVPSRWPGGTFPLELPEHAVSRAWLKMEEALRWSQLPIRADARVAEIGSAPGGASQALLDRRLRVTGIDPAEMHADVLAHPEFTHLRRRVKEVRRREFRKIRWLTADMNVAPSYTLDAVGRIVTHREISIRGLLLTLKLPEWKLAEQVPEFLERVRGWGYNVVRARQLVHNRQELCVAALQRPFRRKPTGKRREKRAGTV